jgi:hypothetical protein
VGVNETTSREHDNICLPSRRLTARSKVKSLVVETTKMISDALTHYQEIALLFRDVLNSDIIPYLIRVLKEVIDEDARRFYVQRLNPVVRWHTIDHGGHSLIEWLDVNRKQCRIVEDIRILNEPKFWELIVHDARGQLIGSRYVDGYSLKLSVKPWDKPVKRHRLNKIMLLNEEHTTIYPLWYKKLLHPRTVIWSYMRDDLITEERSYYTVPFNIIHYETDDSDEAVHEAWILDQQRLLV